MKNINDIVDYQLWWNFKQMQEHWSGPIYRRPNLYDIHCLPIETRRAEKLLTQNKKDEKFER